MTGWIPPGSRFVRGVEIDQEQMIASLEKSHGLGDECPEFLVARLVSRGEDLDQGDNPVIAGMADDDAVLAAREGLGLDAFAMLHSRRRGRDGGRAADRLAGLETLWATVLGSKGQDVRAGPFGDLLGQGVIAGRQDAAVQRLLDVRDPGEWKAWNAPSNTRDQS